MLEKLLEGFMKKNYKRQIKRNLDIKRKVYDNSFNSWIDKKDIE